MALLVYRDYQGAFQRVGSFSDGDSGSRRRFCYDKAYMQRPGSAALSLSLPLREAPYEFADYTGFFEGLVPEGVMRQELARALHVPYSDYLSLLERLGDECIGALRFANEAFEASEEGYIAYGEPELSLAIDSLPNLSIAMVQESRLSIAGAQSKFGVYVDPSAGVPCQLASWYKPEGGAPSTHIVKLADRQFPDLPYNELACLELARAWGLSVPDAYILDDYPSLLVVQRFDRAMTENARTVDGHPVPVRLHQEDMCQALGWAPYLKYEISDVLYARIAGQLITKMSADAIADRELFARYVLFNYLVGNCDGHLKNYSFLYSPDWGVRRLAPLYDVVCTTIMGFDSKMGFSIGEHIAIDEIEPQDWMLFAEDIRLPKNAMINILEEGAAKMQAAIEQAAAKLSGQAQRQLEVITEDMRPRLEKIHSGNFGVGGRIPNGQGEVDK